MMNVRSAEGNPRPFVNGCLSGAGAGYQDDAIMLSTTRCVPEVIIVELKGFEPSTFRMRTERSPS